MLEERPITGNTKRCADVNLPDRARTTEESQQETPGKADRELQETKAAIASEPRWS